MTSLVGLLTIAACTSDGGDDESANADNTDDSATNGSSTDDSATTDGSTDEDTSSTTGDGDGDDTLLIETDNSPLIMAFDETHLYWAEIDTVRSLPLEGGEATPLAGDQDNAVTVVVDGTDLFWTSLGVGANDFADGNVQRVPTAGGTASSIAMDELEAGDLFVEGADLFRTTGSFDLDPPWTARSAAHQRMAPARR